MRRNYPHMPAKGTPFVKGTIDTLQSIINFLPQLDVEGDNRTVTTNHTPLGSIISAIPPKTGARKTTQSEAPAEYKYDGPWSISDVYVEDNVPYVDVKGGFLTLNGYVRNHTQTTKLSIQDAWANSGYQFYIFLHIVYAPTRRAQYDDNVALTTTIEIHRYDYVPIYGYHENEAYFPLGGIRFERPNTWHNECFRVVMPQMMLYGAIPV